ncbi:MAG: DedA family protein [Spirochaetota bacterium]|nr:DedA family protein [Spirochaetota bacterium]
MKCLRRLYDWVLHWAETPYGTPAIFLLAFTESFIFPIPPDVLLIALCLAVRKKAFYYAMICSIASVIGGTFGYFIGWHLWDGVFKDFFVNNVPGFIPNWGIVDGISVKDMSFFGTVGEQYNEYGFLIVFTAGFTPIPYKVITISAGIYHDYINLPIFLLASVISRSARFFLVAWLIYKYGQPINKFIDKYFNILSLLFIILLVGFYLIFKIL